jgi:hypothetical protein
VLGEGEMVATLRRIGSGAHSGAEVEFVLELLMTARNGLVFTQEYFRTREEALAAMTAAR